MIKNTIIHYDDYILFILFLFLLYYIDHIVTCIHAGIEKLILIILLLPSLIIYRYIP